MKKYLFACIISGGFGGLLALWVVGGGVLERPFEIGDNVVPIFEAHAQADAARHEESAT